MGTKNIINLDTNKAVLLGALPFQVNRYFDQCGFDNLKVVDASKFDSDGNALEPGALYCFMEWGYDYDTATGGFLCFFGSDGRFYDADTGEICTFDFDYLVRQVGALNPEYIKLDS